MSQIIIIIRHLRTTALRLTTRFNIIIIRDLRTTSLRLTTRFKIIIVIGDLRTTSLRPTTGLKVVVIVIRDLRTTSLLSRCIFIIFIHPSTNQLLIHSLHLLDKTLLNKVSASCSIAWLWTRELLWVVVRKILLGTFLQVNKHI